MLNNFEKCKCDIIGRNLIGIYNNIDKTCAANGIDPESVTLLAATKTVEDIYINYVINHGVKVIGENKVQELLGKYDSYDLDNAQLHFIGHLQTNKVKQIADKVSMIHSVDSLKLAGQISDCSLAVGKKMPILVEVNIGEEESKGGISKTEAEEFVCQISEFKGIKVNGLMTIPPVCENKKDVEKYFTDMYNLFVDIKSKNIDNIYMEYLSMGMSSDYCEAIKCGANIVRIGSALFGQRVYK